MLKICDFSRLSHVIVKALRYYDEIGLLPPAHIDYFTNYRYYSVEQLSRLARILAPGPYLPGTDAMLSVVHRGPYDTVSDAYTAVMIYLESNRCCVAGPNRMLLFAGMERDRRSRRLRQRNPVPIPPL